MNSGTLKRPQVVVSMTSFPKAIPYAIKAVQSILDGSVVPDKLVLYLNPSEFADAAVPEDLKQLSEQNPVFEIRYCDKDIRSYLKLIPALEDFPDAVIVTIDDDVAYHRHMLRKLLKLHYRFQDAVISHRARHIRLGEAYHTWKKYHWYHFLLKKFHVGFLNLQTGVGGVLYPPHCLKQEMLDPELFTRLAPTVDDVWFWAAAVANGTHVIPVPFGYNDTKDLAKPDELALKTVNVSGETDRNFLAFNAILLSRNKSTSFRSGGFVIRRQLHTKTRTEPVKSDL